MNGCKLFPKGFSLYYIHIAKESAVTINCVIMSEAPSTFFKAPVFLIATQSFQDRYLLRPEVTNVTWTRTNSLACGITRMWRLQSTNALLKKEKFQSLSSYLDNEVMNVGKLFNKFLLCHILHTPYAVNVCLCESRTLFPVLLHSKIYATLSIVWCNNCALLQVWANTLCCSTF